MYLELSQLRVQYPGRSRPAVDDVSLGLHAGDIGVLIGPSGCGKTTLLRAVAGLEPVASGEIRLAQTVVGSASVSLPPEQRRIGMVFQDYALFPHLDVGHNVGFGIHHLPKTERRARVAEVLTLVGLDGSQKRYPHELSGGQQQRVALARALVFQPEMLLLDEPLSALDARVRLRLRHEIKALQRTLGVTTIMVTHDQEEALTMSDRIAVMNDGKVAQVGSPEDLYDRPDNRFVAGFIGESNFLPAVVRGLEDDMVVAECQGTVIRALCPNRPKNGETVTLTTRPERLRFADGAWAGTEATHNRLSVTVTEAVFAGERCRYMLQAGDGTAIVLKEPSSATIRRRTVGERAEITWPVADTILV